MIEFELYVAKLAEKTFSFGELSESEKEELLFFINSNSHGIYENLMANRLQNDDSAKAKLKYLQRRLFPSLKVLESRFPVVRRHVYLYPILIIYRSFIVIKKRKRQKRIAYEVKKLKHFKKIENRGKYN